MFGLDTESGRVTVARFTDFVIKESIPKEKWNDIDWCENDFCDNVELDEFLEHSYYYDDKKVCRECRTNI